MTTWADRLNVAHAIVAFKARVSFPVTSILNMKRDCRWQAFHEPRELVDWSLVEVWLQQNSFLKLRSLCNCRLNLVLNELIVCVKNPYYYTDVRIHKNTKCGDERMIKSTDLVSTYLSKVQVKKNRGSVKLHYTRLWNSVFSEARRQNVDRFFIFGCNIP